MNLIGDVKGKVAVMVDDMIDTAGELSLCSILCNLGQVYKSNNALCASNAAYITFSLSREAQTWEMMEGGHV